MRALLTAILLLLALPAMAQPCLPVVDGVLDQGTLGARFGDAEGPFVSADIQGDRMVLFSTGSDTFDPDTFEYRVRLYDIADPGPPTLLAEFPSTVYGGERVQLIGDTLWVLNPAAWGGYVWSIDVTDPANIPPPPADFSHWLPLPGGDDSAGRSVTDAFLRDDGKLFVFASPWARIYDLNTPGVVTLVNEFRFSPDRLVASAEIVDQILYAAAKSPGIDSGIDLFVWDIGDLTSPVLVSRTRIPEFNTSFPRIRADADRVAVGGPIGQGTFFGVAFVDVSVPASPTVGPIVEGMFDPVAVMDNRAFINGNLQSCAIGVQRGWRSFDISGPASPILLDAVQLAPASGQSQLLAVDGGRAVVASGTPDIGVDAVASISFVRDICGNPIGPYNVLVTSPTVVGPTDTTIRGVPLAEARILVSGSDDEFAPGLLPQAPCSALPPLLTITGNHQIASLRVQNDASVTIEGELTTGSLEAVNGSVITQEQP